MGLAIQCAGVGMVWGLRLHAHTIDLRGDFKKN